MSYKRDLGDLISLTYIGACIVIMATLSVILAATNPPWQ